MPRLCPDLREALRSDLLPVIASVCLLASSVPSAVLAHEPEDRGAIRWDVETGRQALGTGGTAVYVRLRVKAPDLAPARPALNLALVLDRSGSMDEDSKIGYLRQAAHLVTDNLTPQDYAVIVAYNHAVRTLVPLHRVVNREYLHHRIEELHAEGYTNLSGGLLEGCAQLETRSKEPGRHHLILLTDGLANRGVTDPDKLAALAARCAAAGTTITAIGVGTEYDEKLLRGIAQAGKGRYAYVARPEQIPAAFASELGALLAVAAQNATVRMALGPGVELDRIYGSEGSPKGSEVEMPLGDLTSGEERVALVRLRLGSGASTDRPVEVRATLVYDDISTGERTQAEKTVPIEQRSTPGDSGADAGTPLLTYARLVEALDTLALAVNGMDRRAAAEVSRIRKEEYPALKRVVVKGDDQELINKAFLFEHFARELEELIADGALHEHSEARARLRKDLDYQRYLLGHHRPRN